MAPVLFAFGSWSEKNMRGVPGGRRAGKPLMPVPALSPQGSAAFPLTVLPDKMPDGTPCRSVSQVCLKTDLQPLPYLSPGPPSPLISEVSGSSSTGIC